MTAAVVLVVMFTGAITASALGFDLWGAVAQWTRDAFGFETADYIDNSDTIQAVLDENGLAYDVNGLPIPTWLPEGYELADVYTSQTPVSETLHIEYHKAESIILVSIRILAEPKWSTYEKDEQDVIIYTAGGIDHYILSNLEFTNIVWVSDSFECSIAGDFSASEAERIVNSIYKSE